MPWRGHSITYVVVLPKMYNLNLTMRKDQQPKLRDSLQKKWLALIKSRS